jgi:hypothetical protein
MVPAGVNTERMHERRGLRRLQTVHRELALRRPELERVVHGHNGAVNGLVEPKIRRLDISERESNEERDWRRGASVQASPGKVMQRCLRVVMMMLMRKRGI